MKGFTLLEPWASLIRARKKLVETRSWRPPEKIKGVPLLGERLAIHAGKSREAIDDGTADRLFALADRPLPGTWPLGCVVATATLSGWMPADKAVHDGKISPLEINFGGYEAGRWALFLKDVVPIEPIPARGALFFWELSPELERSIVRAEEQERATDPRCGGCGGCVDCRSTP